jgi:hypothetical protein
MDCSNPCNSRASLSAIGKAHQTVGAAGILLFGYMNGRTWLFCSGLRKPGAVKMIGQPGLLVG